MSPEARRILGILARYKVTIPVGALIELGVMPEPRPVVGLSLAQMQEVANFAGTVRWTYSGIIERLVPAKDGRGFVAWGHWTVPHYIAPKAVYACTVFDGQYLSTQGNPDLVYPSLIRKGSNFGRPA